MIVRPAVAGDALAIATIHVRAWQVAYAHIFPADWLAALSVDDRTRMWERLLSAQAENDGTWVADDGGAVHGWLNAGPSRDDDALPGTMELKALYVAPGHWGRGIGKALWAEAARALPASDVIVWVLEQNARAIRFYERAGFVAEADRVADVARGGATRRTRRFRLRPA